MLSSAPPVPKATVSAPLNADEFVERLVRDHESFLVAHVEAIVLDRHLAQDISQETFVRAWLNADRLQAGHGSLRGWLSVVARNLAIDRLRRMSSRREVVQEELPEQLDPAEDDPAALAVSRDQLVRLLPAVTHSQREILFWTYLAGLSTDELAQHLDLPVGTVKSRRHYALRLLRQSVCSPTPPARRPNAVSKSASSVGTDETRTGCACRPSGR